MDTTVSTGLSPRVQEELILKLQTAGLDDDLAQKVIGAKDNTLATRMVALIRNAGSEVPPHPSLRILATGTAIFATEASAVKGCFTDRSVFAYRDLDLDAWLTPESPDVAAGTGTTYQLIKDGPTFQEMAQAVLGETTDDVDVLAKLLIERGKTFSPKRVENIVTRFERGDIAANLRSDGWANLFFVHDGKNRVCVLNASRDAVGWYVNVRRLAYGRRWNAGRRLLVRN